VILFILKQIYIIGLLRHPAPSASSNPLPFMLEMQTLKGHFAAKDTLNADCKGGVMEFDKG